MLMLLACSRSGAPAPASAPPASTPEAPKPDRIRVQVSFAAFEGNDLAGSLDAVAEIVSPDGAAFDRAHEESVLESMLTAGKKDAKKGTMKLSRIRQPC